MNYDSGKGGLEQDQSQARLNQLLQEIKRQRDRATKAEGRIVELEAMIKSANEEAFLKPTPIETTPISASTVYIH